MLKLGIIGVGNIGSGHVERVTGGQCPNIIVTAVADGAVAAHAAESYLAQY